MGANIQRPPQPLYLANGTQFRTKRRKHTLVVEYRLGSGGQGTAFLVKNLDRNRKQVLKMLHKNLANKNALKLLEVLINLRLHKLSPVFKPPLDIVQQNRLLGYVADYAEGEPVDAVVEKAGVDLMQALMACLILAQGFMGLHGMGFLHGDIRDRNIRLHIVDDRPFVYAIDWDSLKAPGLLPSPFIGAIRYMAPEIHLAQKKKQTAIPTEATECYSFAAIFHELITLRYHFAPFDDSAEAVAGNSCKGKWFHDLDSTLYRTVGGYPPCILDVSLANLFRRAFALNPDNRPRLCEWVDALINAISNLYPCPRCGKPLLADFSKTVCPYCNRPFPTLRIVTPSGKNIVVNSQEVVVGRADMGGSKVISRKQLYFRKIGPDVYVQSEGNAGSARMNGNGWERLIQHVLVPVEHGQRIKVGDVEMVLERCELDGSPFRNT